MEIKWYVVIKVRDIIWMTNDREEALTVAKTAIGGKYTFITAYDLATGQIIYEWSY